MVHFIDFNTGNVKYKHTLYIEKYILCEEYIRKK